MVKRCLTEVSKSWNIWLKNCLKMSVALVVPFECFYDHYETKV